MSQLILPATVKYNAERERMAVRHAHLNEFDRQLKELDPNLELVKASEYAEAPGMVPGFWHARMTDPLTGWQTYIVLRAHDGGFSEPHSGHIEMLRGEDLRRPGAMEDLKRRLERKEAEREKQRAWTQMEMREEFTERYLNKIRPSVSFTDAGGWRNRAGARRG